MNKKPLNVEIGARIQLSRERAGMTQEQLVQVDGILEHLLRLVACG